MVDGSTIARTLTMSDVQLMHAGNCSLLVGGSHDSLAITNGVMRNNFYGTIDKVRCTPATAALLYSL